MSDWNGTKRLDGLAVVEGPDGWIILRDPEGGPVLDLCPCCDRPMKTSDAAKRVADLYFPARDGEGVVLPPPKARTP